MLWVPIDVVKERMQVQKLAPRSVTVTDAAAGNYRSTMHALRSIGATEGIRGIYKVGNEAAAGEGQGKKIATVVLTHQSCVCVCVFVVCVLSIRAMRRLSCRLALSRHCSSCSMRR